MKNRVEHKSHRGLLVLLGLLGLAALAAGVIIGYNRLRALWLRQCVIRNVAEQVVITSGKMIKPDVIAGEFGLKEGANLATVDFAEKRAAILRKIPNIRAIEIQRQLPDRVIIGVEEREPIARMNVRGRKTDSGRVVDADGVVFLCSRGTRLLPVIREAPASGTAVGGRLTGRSRAALSLLEAVHAPELQDVAVLEVDVTPSDYLLATLGANYAKLKIAWDGMEAAPTPASTASLERQLRHLKSALRSNVGTGAVVWNATDFTKPGRIYADTKGNLP